MKICPNCASENIKWVTPIENTLWICETCDYIGPVIDGDELLISELLKDCIEQVKDEKNYLKDNKKLIKKSVVFSTDHLEKINLIDGNDFNSKMKFVLDSYFIQFETQETEKELFKEINEDIVEIYKELKEEIIDWSYKIEVKFEKYYFTFSYNAIFLKLCLEKDKIKLLLSFSENKPFDDYKEITNELSENENDEIIRLTFSLNSYDDIEYALFLIKQSYENNKKSSLEGLFTKILPQSKYY